MKTTKRKRKRKPQDATLRNVRAAKKREAELSKRVDAVMELANQLATRVTVLEERNRPIRSIEDMIPMTSTTYPPTTT